MSSHRTCRARPDYPAARRPVCLDVRPPSHRHRRFYRRQRHRALRHVRIRLWRTVGWRLAVNHPQKITAIVSQNGNAYEEGLSAGWADMRTAWAAPTPANREALRRFNTLAMTRWQYTEGVPDPSVIAPETWQLAYAAIERIGVDAQMDLLVDYGQNILQYSQLHAYFRRYQPPTLAIWGKNDPFFTPAGAEAFKRDNPQADVHFLDTGHFAIETHGNEISARMLAFLARHMPVSARDPGQQQGDHIRQ